jgi:hypothetical protein
MVMNLSWLAVAAGSVVALVVFGLWMRGVARQVSLPGEHRGGNAGAAPLRIDVFCEERALDLESRVRLFESVCDTVRAAHAAGMVLESLGPSDVLVLQEGGSSLVEVGGLLALDRSHRGTSAMSTSWRSDLDLRQATIAKALNVHQLGQLLATLARPLDRHAGVERLQRRALSVQKGERFASADALHEAVRELLITLEVERCDSALPLSPRRVAAVQS